MKKNRVKKQRRVILCNAVTVMRPDGTSFIECVHTYGWEKRK